MDIRQLATDMAVFLTPFLPYLILGSEEVAKEIGKKFGQTTLEKAKTLWEKIKKPAKNDPKLQSAIVNLAEDPNDEDFQLILVKSLARLFETSPELATELIGIMKDDKAVQSVLVEYGSRVKDIRQRLSKTGKQEVTVRDSHTGNITQEQ